MAKSPKVAGGKDSTPSPAARPVTGGTRVSRPIVPLNPPKHGK